MSQTKQPSDQPPVTGESAEEQGVDATVEISKPKLGIKELLAKTRDQANFPTPRGPAHRVKKIGNAPRGTRKSMGKR